MDADGNAGNAGQVLSTTGTTTRWVDANANRLITLTSSALATPTYSILLLEPTAAMTLDLPAIANYPIGFELKIRRNNDYTSGVTITIDPDGGETIDGNLTRSLNVGYQSLTLYNTGSQWVTVH